MIILKTLPMDWRMQTFIFKIVMEKNAHCKKKKRLETRKTQRLITVVSYFLISCKHSSIGDMTSDLQGRELVLKNKKKSHPRRKHLLRRNQQCIKSQTKVRAL